MRLFSVIIMWLFISSCSELDYKTLESIERLNHNLDTLIKVTEKDSIQERIPRQPTDFFDFKTEIDSTNETIIYKIVIFEYKFEI